MNRILALLALLAFHVGAPCASQLPSPGAERQAILETARPIAERMAGQPVKFRMDLFNIDAGWALIKEMDICAVEPGYWHVDELEKIGLPCDLFRGLDVPSGVNPLQPREQCKGYREKRLVPPEKKISTPCGDLATELIRSERATPLIDRESIAELATWRASRCETPPSGAGNVVVLCQARTKGGGSLFYWQKRDDSQRVDGFVTCH